MKRHRIKTILALLLMIIIMAETASALGSKAEASGKIQINYMAGTDATINGKSSYTVYVTPGKETTITTVTPTRKGGYNFVGWSLVKDSGLVKFKAGEKVYLFENTTLYPVWQFNIPFVAGDGATINGGPVANVSTYGGKKLTIPNIIPKKSGYTFKGWTDVKNGTVVKYENGKGYTFKAITSLYPVWEGKITYKDEMGDTYKTQKFILGTTVTIMKDTKCQEKAGYEMDGWTTSVGRTTKDYSFNQKVTLTKNLTLYPHWGNATQINVTYMLNSDYSLGRSASWTDGYGRYLEQYTISGNSSTNLTSVKPVPYEVKKDGSTKERTDLEFFGWLLVDPVTNKETVFTSNNTVRDVLLKIGDNHNPDFTLQALYFPKGHAKICSDGGMWYDTQGNAGIYLCGDKAVQFADAVYKAYKSVEKEEQSALAAQKTFWVTLLTTVVPTSIDDFFLDYIDKGKVDWGNVVLTSEKDAIIAAFEAGTFSSALDIIQCVWAGYKALKGSAYLRAINTITTLYSGLNKLGIYSNGKVLSYKVQTLRILYVSGQAYIAANDYDNLMVIPDWVYNSTVKWEDHKYLDYGIIKTILEGKYSR
ncbi:MAG: InlB B-repeat-containing protein [Lachnospiraceae bacterium]|nr:InlB B-repeat-containing protein [Lachnospiraceae bacterium]